MHESFAELNNGGSCSLLAWSGVSAYVSAALVEFDVCRAEVQPMWSLQCDDGGRPDDWSCE